MTLTILTEILRGFSQFLQAVSDVLLCNRPQPFSFSSNSTFIYRQLYV